MAQGTRFDVLIATDGSPQARAAVRTAVAFPWPGGARGHAVIARRGVLATGQAATAWPTGVGQALARSLERLADDTRRSLAERWPDADVIVMDRPSVDGILTRARTLGADVIVVGSRGHGVVGRLVLGSVSRGVVRRAPCPVLVVKGRARRVRRLALGLDGSASARRAVRLVAQLSAPRGGRVTLVSVLEPIRVASMGLLPASVRGAVRQGMARAAAQRRGRARREAERAAAALRRAGWRTRAVILAEVPLQGVLNATARDRADLLVLGARGTGGDVERLVLGSVAEGALGRSPVPVLLVR